ncbi:hypothetical protein MTO96_045446 [Rhipicephalus appendiculatus]
MLYRSRLKRRGSAAAGKPPGNTETPGEAPSQEKFILGGTDEHIAGAEEHIAGAEEHIAGAEEHITGTEEHIAFESVVSSVFATGTQGVP